MDSLLKDIEKSLENSELVVNDMEDLEEVVTPGLGTGCTCAGNA